MVKIYLGNIETKQPKYHLNQQDALNWLIKAHAQGKTEKEKLLIEKKILRFSCLPDKISSRYSELKDFTHENWTEMEFFSHSNRMDVYKSAVTEVFQYYYQNTKTPPAHLIHVSCTGYASPSAAQRLVSEKNWNHNTIVTHCYHMGCYAAFPAIRIGKGFLLSLCEDNSHTSNTNETLDIVHTELCTLHFNLDLNTIDQHVVQSLFADGHAKYTMSSCINGFKDNYFELLALHEESIPETEEAMTWDIGTKSFLMRISKSVPDLILKYIHHFIKILVEKAEQRLNEKIDLKKTIFAIHPGGPKIISSVQNALSLSDDQVTESIQVLKERGNMSSATLPHVWKLILDKKSKQNTPVISIAFGPGLTISGSVMKVCSHVLD